MRKEGEEGMRGKRIWGRNRGDEGVGGYGEKGGGGI